MLMPIVFVIVASLVIFVVAFHAFIHLYMPLHDRGPDAVERRLQRLLMLWLLTTVCVSLAIDVAKAIIDILAFLLELPITPGPTSFFTSFGLGSLMAVPATYFYARRSTG